MENSIHYYWVLLYSLLACGLPVFLSLHFWQFFMVTALPLGMVGVGIVQSAAAADVNESPGNLNISTSSSQIILMSSALLQHVPILNFHLIVVISFILFI